VGGALRDAVHLLGAREHQVQGDGLWALGLGVCVAEEGLRPPARRVRVLGRGEGEKRGWLQWRCGDGWD